MCRYRKYIYVNCDHVEYEATPYLPCVAEGQEYCSVETTTDRPITLNKNTACAACAESAGMPLHHSIDDGGTSWRRTNSTNRGRALGPGEGDPGDRLRHTVSVKMKESKMAKLVRSVTKKNRDKKNNEANSNGADGFLPDNPGSYNEIGNEMADLKK